jgi:hypothetical protein
METKVILSPDKEELWLVDQHEDILVIMSTNFYKYHYRSYIIFSEAKQILLEYFKLLTGKDRGNLGKS